MPEGPRVLLVGTEFPPSPAGTAVYARSLALGLAAHGADVAVLTQAPRGGAGTETLPLPVTRVPFTGSVPRRYARHLGALRGCVERFRPDLVWTTNGMGTRVAGLAGLACPLITCARGSDIRTRLPARGLWRRWEGRWQRRAYERSAAVAAASRELRDYAVGQGLDAERLFLSHSAFDFSRVDTAPKEQCREGLTVLTVARLTRQKRVDVLLRAFARVAPQLPAARLTVVGDGPERGALEALVDEAGLGDRVRFTGALEPFSEALCSEYRRADLFALVSVGEGLANVFIEAGAFGLPAVGADSGGTPEIVRDGVSGWLARPDDVEHLAAVLAQGLGSAADRARFGAAARAHVEQEYGIDALGRRSLAVVHAVLAGRPLPAQVRLP